MFARKGVAPEETRSRLLVVQRELGRHENENQDWATSARAAAKASLRLGDLKGFHKEALRYSLATRQAETLAAMLETAHALMEVAEAQPGVDALAGLGAELETIQRQLGIDDRRLSAAMAHVRLGVELVNQESSRLVKRLKMVTLEEASDDEVEVIRAELLAEIKNERTMDTRVKQEIQRDARHA